MKVLDWITQHPRLPATVPPESPLEAIVDRILAEPGLRDIFVVSSEGVLIGHIGHRRLTHLLLAEHRPEHTQRQIMERVVSGTAMEIMEPHFTAAKPDEDLDDVLHRQLDSDLEDMQVIDASGMPLGVINLTQILEVIRGNSVHNFKANHTSKKIKN